MRPISNVFASWTDSGTIYTGIGLNVVATAYNSLSRPFNIRFNGSSLFSVDTTGVIRNSTINAIFSTANASFNYANNLAVSSGNPSFAFEQANNAYDRANAAFVASSNSSGTTGGGTDKIFLLNGVTVTANYSIPSNNNAMTAGPITINSDVTVTINTGSVWIIV